MEPKENWLGFQQIDDTEKSIVLYLIENYGNCR